LIWALFGVASPGELITDVNRTPFNVGKAISLPGFSLEEATPLLAGLQPFLENPSPILSAILEWTDGQPFLTQKICALVQQMARSSPQGQLDRWPGQEGEWIGNLIQTHLIENWQMQDEPEHLRTIQRFVMRDPTKIGRILGLYQQLLMLPDGIPLETVADLNAVHPLILSGLVINRGKNLTVHNRIYSEVFNLTWVRQQLASLRPYAAALDAWIKSGYQDESQLLRSQTLQEAQTWSQGKSLSDLDYQFLAASQMGERRYRERRIVEILAVLNYRSGHLQPYLKQVAVAVSELIQLDWSVVTLCRGEEERILSSSFDLGEAAEKSYSLHMTLTGYVLKSGCPLYVEDTAICKDFGEAPEGYRSYLGVPLRLSTGEIVGTICSFHAIPRQIDEEEIRLATIFAERAASAIENYQLYQKLEKMNAEHRQQLTKQDRLI
jgi:GAF domain-containing protein